MAEAKVVSKHQAPDGWRFVVKVEDYGVIDVLVARGGLVTSFGSHPPATAQVACNAAKKAHLDRYADILKRTGVVLF